jgi:hypothetical protein
MWAIEPASLPGASPCLYGVPSSLVRRSRVCRPGQHLDVAERFGGFFEVGGTDDGVSTRGVGQGRLDQFDVGGGTRAYAK